MTEQTEPSMEEILSSIRRILSTEESEKNNTEQKVSEAIAQKEEAHEEQSDVMELTSDMLLNDDKDTQENEKMTPAEDNSDMELLSEATLNATADRLSDLTEHLIRDERPVQQTTGTQSLEDFVASLLRPYLKEWLDANLPNIVEKIVSKEVERLTKRSR